VTGVPEKAIFRSVPVYNKYLSSQCNLPAQVEQVQDKILNLISMFLLRDALVIFSGYSDFPQL
jgi:hypothetical protein